MKLKLKCVGHSLQMMPDGERTMISLSAAQGTPATANLSLAVTHEEAAKMPVGSEFELDITRVNQ